MHVIGKDGHAEDVSVLDVLPTRRSADGALAIAAVNKHASEQRDLRLVLEDVQHVTRYRVLTVNGASTESYNDIGGTQVTRSEGPWQQLSTPALTITLSPHSVNVIEVE